MVEYRRGQAMLSSGVAQTSIEVPAGAKLVQGPSGPYRFFHIQGLWVYDYRLSPTSEVAAFMLSNIWFEQQLGEDRANENHHDYDLGWLWADYNPEPGSEPGWYKADGLQQLQILELRDTTEVPSQVLLCHPEATYVAGCHSLPRQSFDVSSGRLFISNADRRTVLKTELEGRVYYWFLNGDITVRDMTMVRSNTLDHIVNTFVATGLAPRLDGYGIMAVAAMIMADKSTIPLVQGLHYRDAVRYAIDGGWDLQTIVADNRPDLLLTLDLCQASYNAG